MSDMDQAAPGDTPSSRHTDHASPPAIRLVAEDREAVIARLSAAFAEDHLTTEEFELRVAEVYRATTHDALTRLTGDLPADEGNEGAAPTRPAMAGDLHDSGERRATRPRDRAVPPADPFYPRKRHPGSAGGGFHDGVTEITVHAFLGNVEVALPRDVAMECHGSALLGNFAHSGAGARPDADSTRTRTVRITGRAVLGNVEFGGEPGRLRRPARP